MPATETTTHERFFTVITVRPVELSSYLYDHTEIVNHVVHDRYDYLLLRTTADSAERAEYLANYQAGRIRSGLHGVSDVFATQDEALAPLARFGVDLTPKPVIDHAALRTALRGPSEDPAFPTADAHQSADKKGTIVYLGNSAWLDITEDGHIWFHPSSLGTATVVGHSSTTEEVFKAARLFVTQHSVWAQAAALLARLEHEVPNSVAHYAVEDAKKALKVLKKQAYTIDYFHGR